MNDIYVILYVYDEFEWYFEIYRPFSVLSSNLVYAINSLIWNSFSFFDYVGIKRIKADGSEIIGVIQRE